MGLTIVIADDHKIMREGLKNLLEGQDGITVLAEAQNGREAVRLTQELRPDVVLMDISMPDMNGIEATRRITAEIPGTAILALSMHDDSRFVTEALGAGARGYLLKECAFDELVQAIRSVSDGFHYLSPRITGVLVKDFVNRNPREAASGSIQLSPREREVLQLLAEGKNTKEIAFILNVGVKTVESQRTHVMKKLNLHTIAELTKYAVREGITSA